MESADAKFDPGTLRRALSNALRTDSEFEMFCMDYFPTTQCMFSSGMDRVAKQNLLLAREPAEQIMDHLKQWDGSYSTLRTRTGQPALRLTSRDSICTGWPARALCAFALCGLGAFSFPMARLWRRHSVEVTPAVKVVYGYILDIHTDQPVVDAAISVVEQFGVGLKDGVAHSDSRGFFVLEGSRPISEGDTLLIDSQSCRSTRRPVRFVDTLINDPWGNSIPNLQWPTLLYRVDCHVDR